MDEKEIREQKLIILSLLANQMVSLNHAEYKDFTVSEDKPIAYIDATIDIINKQIEKENVLQAKKLSFNKLESERKNLTPEELKQLEADQRKQNARVDSFLATMEPRCSLRGNLAKPNSVVLRYRGKSVDDEFSQKYPYGVLM
ncbi:hypothetical protein LCGC14_0889180 [marine sediment metagenome]|uniref:Uncharacterized protein n=1 Tax=marine sediment metagenome TaxID=412755 RepID=A0A0F9PKI1_9ZZZZ|nr:hypothetical protein [bacterium]